MTKILPFKTHFMLPEYLGSNGMSIRNRHTLYRQKCKEFRKKANKYKRENLALKKSIVPRVKLGYEANEDFERDILDQRKEQLEVYKKMYDVTHFYEDDNEMYECFKGKSKAIRIIRELKSQETVEILSEDDEKGSESWFTRYCILSKFIQAARMIIIKNRMLKNLDSLKHLTPKKVARLRKSKNYEGQILRGSITEDLSEYSIKAPNIKDSRTKVIPCLTRPCGKCPNKRNEIADVLPE